MNFENAKIRPVFAPPRDAVTGNQLSMLLNAAHMMISCARAPSADEDEGGAKDGGTKSAAEATFIKICDRIDQVLDDSSRWSMENQDTLEKDMSGMLKAQTSTAEMHRRILNHTQLPHFRFHPKLVKLKSAWIAVVGDLQDRAGSIIAIGLSPQDAFNHFDRVFMGRETEETHQDLLDELLKETKQQRKDLTNAITVDRSRNNPVDNTAQFGTLLQSDSNQAGEEPGLSNSESETAS